MKYEETVYLETKSFNNEMLYNSSFSYYSYIYGSSIMQ